MCKLFSVLKCAVTRLNSLRYLSLVICMAFFVSANAQNGYYWTFASSTPDPENNNHARFNSTPATGSTSGNQYLTELILNTVTTGTTENPGITGTSCTSAVPVGSISQGSGLEFLNSGPMITSAYTIEMLVKFTSGSSDKRLVGFYDLGGEDKADYGIYLNASGEIMFYTEGVNDYTITSSPLSLNTWYHLAITRSSAGVITYYKNGTATGSTYTDAGNYFLPHSGVAAPSSYNIVTFFRDNNGEEAGVKVARIGVFDAELSSTVIGQHVSDACAAIPESTWNTEGNIGTNATHFIGTKNSQPLIFKTNNTEALRVTSAGQVLIGTQLTPANYKLAVGGALIATKVRVNEVGAWPDYVFDKKYKLPSLYELEKYIQQHQHLPGIPSAAEVDAKGVDLGTNQAALLQKIEELTLYIIEQNKKTDELNAKILAMEKEMQQNKKQNK